MHPCIFLQVVIDVVAAFLNRFRDTLESDFGKAERPAQFPLGLFQLPQDSKYQKWRGGIKSYWMLTCSRHIQGGRKILSSPPLRCADLADGVLTPDDGCRPYCDGFAEVVSSRY
jgi:hypothetical protein